MKRSWSGGHSNVQSKKGKRAHLGFMISLSAFGHLEFVQNDKAVDWEAWNEQRGGGKANQDLVIKQPVRHGKEFGFYHEGHGEPQQGSKEGGNVIKCIFSFFFLFFC